MIEQINHKSESPKLFSSSSLLSIPFQLLPHTVNPPEGHDKVLSWQREFALEHPELPKLSVCILGTQDGTIDKLFETLSIQSYENFEILAACCSQQESASLKSLFDKYELSGKIICSDKTTSKQELLRTCIEQSSGNYNVIIDNKHIAHPQALFIIAKEIQENRSDLYYTNEVILSKDWNTVEEYYRKGAPDKYSLFSYNPYGEVLIISDKLSSIVAKSALEAPGNLLFWHISTLAHANEFSVEQIPIAIFLKAKEEKSELNQIEISAVKAIVSNYSASLKLEIELVSIDKQSPNAIVKLSPKDPGGTIQAIVPFKNQSELTIRCIQSLEKQSIADDIELTLVNNNSDPEELQKIEDAATKLNIKNSIISVDSYFNFAKLNNVAASKSTSDFILFLNNDVYLNEENTIEELRRWSALSKVALTGGLLRYDDGSVQSASINFASSRPMNIHSTEHLLDVVKQCHGLTFALALCKREVFNALGGLSEYYCPNGFGDALFCNQINQADWQCLYVPHAQAIHSTSKTRQLTPEELELYEMHKLGLTIPDLLSDFSDSLMAYKPNFRVPEPPAAYKLAAVVQAFPRWQRYINSISGKLADAAQWWLSYKTKKARRLTTQELRQ